MSKILKSSIAQREALMTYPHERNIWHFFYLEFKEGSNHLYFIVLPTLSYTYFNDMLCFFKLCVPFLSRLRDFFVIIYSVLHDILDCLLTT